MHFLYEDEVKEPYHLKRPDFSSLSSEVTWKNQTLKLYLELNKKEVVVGAYFQAPLDNYWMPYLSAFCRWVEGKKLFEVDFAEYMEWIAFENDDFILIPHALFSRALETQGTEKIHCELLKQEASSLVCRCFGVYEKQIIEQVKRNPDIDLKGITDESLAGGACTSCAPDIMGIVTATKDSFGLSSAKNQHQKIQGLYPAQMIERLDSLFKENHLNLEIISLIGYDLTLKATAEIELEKISELLKSNTSVGFRLRLL